MNELVFEKSDKAVVFVDDRELKSVVAKLLFARGALLKAQRLDIADFVLSPRVGIERKTMADFESSIIDGRLFSQAQELSATFSCPIICIIGSEAMCINPGAIRGAKISMVVDYRIPILHFEDDAELADFLYHIAEREQLRPLKESRIRFEKPYFTVAQQQKFIVESLPLIGPVQAKRLLEHFGSVIRVVTASEKELQDCEGIGKVRAQAIRKVLDQPFNPLSKEWIEEKEGD